MVSETKILITCKLSSEKSYQHNLYRKLCKISIKNYKTGKIFKTKLDNLILYESKFSDKKSVFGQVEELRIYFEIMPLSYTVEKLLLNGKIC